MDWLQLQNQIKANTNQLSKNKDNEKIIEELYNNLYKLINSLIKHYYNKLFTEDEYEDLSYDLALSLVNRILNQDLKVDLWLNYLTKTIRSSVYKLIHHKRKFLSVEQLIESSTDFPIALSYNPEKGYISSQQINNYVSLLIKQLRLGLPIPEDLFNMSCYLVVLAIIYDLDLSLVEPSYLGSRLKLYKEQVSSNLLGSLETHLKEQRRLSFL